MVGRGKKSAAHTWVCRLTHAMLGCESNLNEEVKSKEETAAENGTTERRKGKIRTCRQLQGLHSATLMEPEASSDKHDC